ncbi:hypothetical protein N7462_006828 [Penicillium macrosclerotiorum]|uniref:uncharacterized protein n=1 Tax=Penicillium macrosclerotiorum TaxID=303699 RepID=UPI0025488740|nr:uncharacterized protein N7462_006828 [Penicillium macrosclerotiorum]KAJ5678584.1 hypothetical protein N7462_006828 [Penicillium macrosclerotiorum]
MATRSFFKKPTLAGQRGDPTTEFYRRSEQTYSDIVAANREARKKQKDAPESPTNKTIDTARISKRRCISTENNEQQGKAIDVESPQVTETGEPREEQDVPSNSTPETSSNPDIVKSDQETRITDYPPTPTMDLNRHDTNTNDFRSHAKLPTIADTPNHSSPSSMDDPTVQILITSDIPNTKPLLVHRKMSQGLREVRLAWCKRQEFSSEETSCVHLTWKGRRVFDVTTCRSLGIKTDRKPAPNLVDDDLTTGPSELRIHMEAATNEPLLLKRPGSSPDIAQSLPVPQDVRNEQPESMKLVLKTPGLKDFRIKARPTTLVSKLISAFRGHQNIPAAQNIVLLFDGDRLDPDACLEDYEVADLDMVEVQINPRISS